MKSNTTDIQQYTADGVALLRQLIATPSVSRDEGAAADILEDAMQAWQLHPMRSGNNVWAVAEGFDNQRPTLLLNAHIDTVRPVASWTRDPFTPSLEDGRLYGLGSNDCGGGLVALLQAFRMLNHSSQPYNLIYLASAEEEVSGANGLSSVLPLLPPIQLAVVGEPTGMNPAVAEKGLMVVDMTARGRSGHAARGEGVNAIYAMLDDLLWLRDYRFEKVSDFLGPTLMSVTVLHSGTQHNVIPDTCEAVIDIRTNEYYTNEEVFDIIRSHVKSEVKARSFRLRSSSIALNHPVVVRCREMGMKPFGSPTLSDQALMPFPSLKLGPGDSSRSHAADEYIGVDEITDAITKYLQILDQLKIED
ncbi:MAG: M20 family metallo-hydrolase [Prevotella sp.]|nr:M20 family metallo-hydrolase [Prevotella sp.]